MGVSTPPASGPPRLDPARLKPGARLFGRGILLLRLLLVAGWVAIAVVVQMKLPAIRDNTGQQLVGSIPADSPPLVAEVLSVQRFDVPVVTRTMVVQHDPGGFTTAELQRVASIARTFDDHRATPPPALRGLLFALPVANPLQRPAPTAIVTYLFFPPQLDIYRQDALAHRYASLYLNQPGDHVVGVTGTVPVTVAESNISYDWLPDVEIATVVLIALVVGLTFRAILAPLMTLGGAFIAYIVATHLLALVAQRTGQVIPDELEPLIVVLLLGVITDYAIFFLSAYRRRLADAGATRRAGIQAIADTAPIIAVAGIAVAGGSAALFVARLTVFHALGPGMGLAVAVGMVVAVTFVPAAATLFGRATFWPGGIPNRHAVSPALDRENHGMRARMARLFVSRPMAALVAALSIVALLALATPARFMGLGLLRATGLPSSSDVERAEVAAEQGFPAGITGPTAIVLQRPGIGDDPAAVGRVEAVIRSDPGVGLVLGPQEAPQQLGFAAATSSDRGAVRLVVLLRDEPSGAPAVATLDRIEARMPSALAGAGLAGTQASYAGDTAIADYFTSTARADLARIALAVCGVELLLLVVFLRALVAPLYLIFASSLALLASLGITTLVFQGLLHSGDLTFYVPFATGVLLLALGSDYNIFVIGRIWDEARVRPLRSALLAAVPHTRRAVGLAGITLAASFSLLAMVPLLPFREFAFAMALGVLLDVFVVRLLLMPSLIVLFGRAGGWPGGRLRRAPAAVAPPAPPPPPRTLQGTPQAAGPRDVAPGTASRMTNRPGPE